MSFLGELLLFRKKMHHPKPCSLQIHPRLFADKTVDTNFFQTFFEKRGPKRGVMFYMPYGEINRSQGTIMDFFSKKTA